MQFGFRKKGVLVSWTLSYLIVLLLPFFVNTLFHMQNEKILYNEVQSHNMLLLNYKSRLIDEMVDDLSKLMFDISFGTRVSDVLSNSQGASGALNIFEVSKLSLELKDYEADRPYVKNIFVYLSVFDQIVTANGIYDSDDAYIAGFGEKEKPLWKQTLMGQYSCSFIKVGERTEKIYFAYSGVGRAESSLNLLIEVDLEKILSAVLAEEDDIVQNMVILGSDNSFLAGTGDDEINELLSGLTFDEENEVYYEEFSGEKYMILADRSAQGGLKYIYMIEESSFFDAVSQSKMWNIASLFVCCAVGLVLILWFVRKNYNPVSKLLKLLDKDIDKEEGRENEFDYVSKTISGLLDKKQEFTSRLSKQENLLRNSILVRLLKGNASENFPIADVLESLEIRFEKPFFLVAAFYIENAEELFFEENKSEKLERNKKLAGVAITNVMAELLTNEHCTAVSCENDELLFLILNTDSDLDEMSEFVNQQISQGKDFLEAKCNIFFTAGISEFHVDICGVALGYSEVLECIEQRFLLQKEEIISFKALGKDKATGYYFPFEQEQKIINCLRTGQFNECSGILDEIYEANFRQQQLSVGLAKCLMFDIVGSIIKALTDIGGGVAEEFFTECDPFEKILAVETAASMMSELKAFLREICQYIEMTYQKANNSLIGKIDEYLKDSYSDINVNVAAIAQHLGMNATYLSNVFKKQNGIGLLEYITKLRVEKAKEIMSCSPEISLEELAGKVGYSNIRTFSRVFAKHAGISPGRFKEIAAKRTEVKHENE